MLKTAFANCSLGQRTAVQLGNSQKPLGGNSWTGPYYNWAASTPETPVALGLEPKPKPRGKSPSKALSLNSQGRVQGRG